jgi:type I site-specific restriction endonuclease
MPLTPEQLAREKIDAQLVACGWVIQRYKDYDPSASRGIALIEVPVKAGTADYLLLVDKQPIGVIEAKKEGKTPARILDQIVAPRWVVIGAKLFKMIAWEVHAAPPSGSNQIKL